MRWARSSSSRCAALLALAACRTPAPEGVTWSDHVAPIVADRCVRCHADDHIAPFSLQTWETAATWADQMLDAVHARRMPPAAVDASGACQTYRDVAWLSDAEVATLDAWVAGGAQAGEGATAVPPPPEPEHVEVPTRVLDQGLDYAPLPLEDDYRCFLVDPELEEDAFLTRYEVVPGDPRIVHHVILYTLDSAVAEDQADALDAADAIPGYGCFGSSVVADSRPIAAWAPGTPTTRFPEGTGIRLLAGRRLVVQVHYHPIGAEASDRTELRLELADSVPNEALVFLLADLAMRLEPGLEVATHTWDLSLASIGLPLGAFVQGVFPHMHRRGRTLRLERVDERGTECMTHVPAWSFDWQQMFFYDDPFYLYPSDTLRLTCTYDTRDDVEEVAWGEGTEDEMCLVGLYATIAR